MSDLDANVRPKTAGRLIAVSGIDGTGKTSLVSALVARLRSDGLDAVAVRPLAGDPEFFSSFGELRGRLHSEPARDELEAFLGRYSSWTLVRNYLMTVAPELERNRVVILDRWLADHVASQQCFGVQVCPDEQPLSLLPEAGTSIWLRCPPQLARERIVARDPDRDNFDEVFLSRFQSHLGEWFATEQHAAIDTSPSADEVLDTAYAHVRQVLA